MQAKRKKLASQPQENGELQLFVHHMDGKEEYELVTGGVFVMATYNALSSMLLVRNAAARCSKSNARLLIGGLGFGYSIAEALALPQIEQVDVVELTPEIIQWNQTLLSHVNGALLSDARVVTIEGDFVHYVQQTEKTYDLICMDIDNGPMLLVHPGNERAYSTDFFRRVAKVLRPGGVFGIWSCNADDDLKEAMARVFSCTSVDVVMENHRGRDVPYYLYYGQRDA